MKFATASAVVALQILFAPAVFAQNTVSPAAAGSDQTVADAPTGDDVVVTGTRERGVPSSTRSRPSTCCRRR
ncbi:hypothetical protein P0F65_07115 [Sphingomonas sp. I4]